MIHVKPISAATQAILQVILAAGTLLLKKTAALQGSTSTQHYEIQSVVGECIIALRIIAGTWQCAERYVNQLEVLLQGQTQQAVLET
jgi:hypothetical protein